MPSSPPLPSLSDPPSPTSSEPPLFSSDDPLDAEEAINYISPRFKRKRIGPWWEAEPSETLHIPKKPRQPRNLSRNYDSGVWLPSDESDEMDAQQLPAMRKAVEDDPTEEQLLMELEKTISRCGLSYHFDHYRLRDKHLKHLRQLNQVVVPVRNPDTNMPAEGQFRTMVPELVLNLSHNMLLRPGPPLFEIQNLVHLNLSNNSIEQLPPQIRSMRNLRTMNLTNNSLEWLPYEILDLLVPCGNLQYLQLLGNPLIEKKLGPTRGECAAKVLTDTIANYLDANIDHNPKALWDLLPETESPFSDYTAWTVKCVEFWAGLPQPSGSFPGHFQTRRPAHLGNSVISYYDDYDSPVKGSPSFPVSAPDLFLTTVTSYGTHGAPPTAFIPEGSKAPSLRSIALTESLKHLRVSEVEGLLGITPPMLQPLLDVARENEEHIGCATHVCAICHRPYVSAKVKWIEFWFHEPTCNILPIKRQGCTWACVPQQTPHPHRGQYSALLARVSKYNPV